MKLQFDQLVFATSVLVVLTEIFGLKCKLGTFHKFKKDGRERCRRCTMCDAGEGWNTSVMLEIDADRGFLGCFPCERCPTGYYRQANAVSQTCNKCVLDCKSLNRYGSIECGFNKPGHCGECRAGYRPESSEPNGICRKPGIALYLQDIVYSKDVSPHFLVTTVTVIVAVILYFLRNRAARQTQVLSSEEILLSNLSPPVSADVLDVDGPTPVQARKELQSKDKSALPPAIKCHGPIVDRVKEQDDNTLSIIASLISGKRVHVFFRCLQLHSSKIDPHEELWEKGKISKNYILDVLIEWTKSAYPKPTLPSLCTALETASFDDVIDQVLALEENSLV